jgi:hypothetical protein
LHNLQSDISKQLEAGDNLTKRQTSSLLKKLAANDNELENLQKQLGYNNTLLALTRINTQELEKQQKVREAEKAAVEDINKQLGFYPKLLSGLDKNLKRLGLPELGAKKAIDETYKLGQEAKSSGKEFKASGEFVGQLKNNIGGALTKANLLQWAITELILALKATDDGAGDMAKKMNLTYTEALRVRGELGTIAGISGDAALNTKNLQESYMAVGQALGSNAMLNQQDLITMTKLTKQAGFTHDELMGIEKLSLVNGKTLEKNTQEILGGAKAYASRNKLVLNEKQILREVNSASASLKLSLGGSAEQVAIAAAKAKQFGLNLEQAEKISHSLLEFEDSISSELEAELLTGKEFNFERARSLALEGKTAEAAAEVAKQVGSAKNFGKLNVIQQEAIAKSMGMQRDELAQSLIDKEALAKLSAEEGETAQQAFNRLVEEVGMEEAKKRLGDEQIAKQYEQQSIQERFNATIEKLKEIFISLVTPLMPVLDVFAGILQIVGTIVGGLGQMLKFLVPIAKWVGIIAIGYKTIQFAVDGLYRKTVLINAAKKIGLITDRQAIMTQNAANILAKGKLLTENQSEMVKRNSLLLTIKNNIQKKLELAFGKQSLATQIKESAIKAKSYLITKGENALLFIKTQFLTIGNNLASIGNTIAKSGLVKMIGQAVMTVVRSLSSLGPWGIAAGIASGAGVAALGYKFMKGNDIMSAGKGKNGYGKRTLLAPEGAIALNDKDTVIAGTDLGGKGKGQQSQASSSPSINMQPMIDKLAAVESVLNQILNKSSDVYMDSTKVGTALNIGSVQIQ